MKKILLTLSFILSAPLAHANWEYSGGYGDDGGRLTFSVRAGVASPISATMQNDLGQVPTYYYTDNVNQIYVNDHLCGDIDGLTPCNLLANADLGKLPVAKEYSEMSFAGGAALGVVLAGNPNIRLELDWLHISKSTYSADPLFQGEIETALGTIPNLIASARGTSSTDVISAMFYYDFFTGYEKPERTLIPYVGLGLGYAVTTTTLELTDAYRDLNNVTFDGFGIQTAAGTIDFFTSENETGNFALSGALGFSYGIQHGIFFDIGARASYTPRIVWALNNKAHPDQNQKSHNIFSANDVVFVNIYAGMRFEF